MQFTWLVTGQARSAGARLGTHLANYHEANKTILSRLPVLNIHTYCCIHITLLKYTSFSGLSSMRSILFYFMYKTSYQHWEQIVLKKNKKTQTSISNSSNYLHSCRGWSFLLPIKLHSRLWLYKRWLVH